jgi:microcompartment protein CcmK/EutM
MRLAKVIGNVTSTIKIKDIKGVSLLVIQPINSKYEPIGSPIVAGDNFGAGVGEYVFFSKSKEGAMNLPIPTAGVDAGITGIVDYFHVEENS